MRASAVTVLGLGVLSLALASGCVAKDCETEDGRDAVCVETPERYRSPDFDQTLVHDYFPGEAVSIDGIYGNIEVVEGAPGEVSATFRPFAYSGQNEDQRALDAIRDKLVVPEIELDGDTLLIRSDRTDAALPLVGADLEIALPPEFDGALVVRNQSRGNWNPGNVDLDYVGFAPSVEVTAGDLSDCEVTGGPDVVYTSVRCHSDIRVLDVSDDVQIESTGLLGSVTLVLSSIGDQATGGSLSAGEDVSVTFPSGASFSVEAEAEAPGVVDFGTLPASCSEAVAAETAKSLTCGEGGPLYVLNADGNVSLSVE